MMSKNEKDRVQKIIQGAYDLSLGISIIVAILLGAGIGYAMMKIFEVKWVFFIGLFWGISAAVLNVYRAYKSVQNDLEELASDPKYQYKKKE